MIRYIFLNSLKINVIAFASMKGLSVKDAFVSVNFVIILVINLLAIVLSLVMFKIGDKLEDPKIIKHFGTLY